MNLVALETFLAIVETGNLVRASERMNVTQSTVTARLKLIEEELGQTLMHRHRSGVRLTAAGATFKRYAETMTQLWRQARQETRLPEGIDTIFNLGCDIDLWPGLGQTLVTALRREEQTTGLSAWPAAPGDLDTWLSSGLIGAAITYHVAAREGRTVRPVCRETLVLVSNRPDTPMRADAHYVYVDLGDDFGRRHAEEYADAGVAKISFGSAVWARDYLLENDGSAYLPERLAAPLIDAGALYPIEDAPVFHRTVHFIANDSVVQAWPWLVDQVVRIAEAAAGGSVPSSHSAVPV
jgi:DNA-binding transcriptional LysR family regulator